MIFFEIDHHLNTTRDEIRHCFRKIELERNLKQPDIE